MPSRRDFMRQLGGMTIGAPLATAHSRDGTEADYEINLYQSKRLIDEFETMPANQFRPAANAKQWLESTMLACNATADVSIVFEPIAVNADDTATLLQNWDAELDTRPERAADSNVLIDVEAPSATLGQAFVSGKAAVSFSGTALLDQRHPTLWENGTTSAAAVVHEVLHNLGFEHEDGTAYKLDAGGFGIDARKDEYPLYLTSIMLASYALDDIDGGESDNSPEIDDLGRLWVSTLPTDEIASTLEAGEYGSLFFNAPQRACHVPQSQSSLFGPPPQAQPQDRDVDGIYETVKGCQLTVPEIIELFRTVNSGPAQTPVGRRGLDINNDDAVDVDEILRYVDARFR